MNTRALLDLQEAARSERLDLGLLKKISVETNRSCPELLETLSTFVARQFSSKAIDFQEADEIMNVLWGLVTSDKYWGENDQSIPPRVKEVYEAFDAGEYHHSGDPNDSDPVAKYTKPLIEAFLAASKDGA